jgi:outer membrane protein
MSKKWIVPMLALALLAATPFVRPAEAQDLKIGYIVTPRLLGESKLGKESAGKLKARAEQAEKGLEKKMADLQKLQQDIEKRMSVLNDEERAKLGEEYERQVRDAKRMREDAQREFEKARGEIEGTMMEKFRAVIEKFATDNGYDLILDAGTLLYISEKADVTDEVIRAADKAS